jgi:hypothetical protein
MKVVADALGSLGQALSGLELSNDLAETALCGRHLGITNPFFILNGDFRKEYEGIIDQGWDACYAFWLSQAEEHKSNWSHDPLPTTETVRPEL